MQNNKSILIVVFFYMILTCNGQEAKAKSVKRIRLADFYSQMGMATQWSSKISAEDAKQLAPQSKLLNENFTNYSPPDLHNWRSSSTAMSCLMGFQIRDKEKSGYRSHAMFRLGLLYSNGVALSNPLYKEERKRIDTIFSSQPGQSIYRDSLKTFWSSMGYSSDQFLLDGSLIYRTNPQSRWSVYVGVGVAVGASINARTYIDIWTWIQTDSRYANGNHYGYYHDIAKDEFKFESYRNKMNYGLSTYAPLGLDFRIGKKRRFWRQTHLFYELRSGINFTVIPELRTFSSAIFQNGIGIKVSME